MNVASVKSRVGRRLINVDNKYPHFDSWLLTITAIHGEDAVRCNSTPLRQIILRALIACLRVTHATIRCAIRYEIKPDIGICPLEQKGDVVEAGFFVTPR
jgi:hypothetical protein